MKRHVDSVPNCHFRISQAPKCCNLFVYLQLWNNKLFGSNSIVPVGICSVLSYFLNYTVNLIAQCDHKIDGMVLVLFYRKILVLNTRVIWMIYLFANHNACIFPFIRLQESWSWKIWSRYVGEFRQVFNRLDITNCECEIQLLSTNASLLFSKDVRL